MPPTHSSAYFPPLDKCLAGDDRLISWKAAYRALCDLDGASENSALEEFLTDPQSTNFLSNALDPYLPPGAKTKAEFETKTAPIHVSQSANGDYDLEELKKDAIWLSEQVDVEQLICLRVVILEWQQRAHNQLLASVANNGSAAIVARSDLSASTLAASTSNLGSSTNGATKPIIDFGTEEIRRHRQLQIFLEEKSNILNISTALVSQVAAKGLATTTCKWISDLAEKITADQCRTNDATTHEKWCEDCIDSIDSMLATLLDPSKCRDIFKSDNAKAIMCEATTFTDVTTAMRMLLANLYLMDGFAGYALVSAWFKLMAKMNFFHTLVASPALPSVEPSQCLVSVISVTMLHVSTVVKQLQTAFESMLRGSVQYPQLDGHRAYYANEACFKEINLILYNAAQENMFVATPAIFAWSIIATYIRDIAIHLRDRREQQEESSDGELVSRRRASRRDSRDDFSIFEKLYMHLQDFELEADAREDPAKFFARVSVDTAFSVIPRLGEVLSAAYGSKIDEVTSFFGRQALLGLIRQGMILVTYGAETLEAVLSLLSPDVNGRSTTLDRVLIDSFLEDEEVFRPTILGEAFARYPFEISPLLRLLNMLAQSSNRTRAGPTELVYMLENLQTLTVMVTEDFRDYALEHEDENINSMVLKQYIPLFASKQALAYGVEGLGRRALTMGSEGTEDSNILAVPAGAIGSVVKESRPLVFRLEHSHSALEYLGLLASTIRPNSEFVTAPFEDILNLSTAADIVTLATALLKASLKQHQGVAEAQFVLGRLSNSLPDGQDIISVIADIFETELLSHLDQSVQQGSLELLVACTEFLHVVTYISPERVWSILARSSLLGLAGGATALAAVVAGMEVQSGRFRFLGACATLFSHLIDDAISGLIKRKAKVNKATNRFDSPMSFQDATPERTMTTVVNAYQSVMVDAWQNVGEWRFVLRSEKIEIINCVLTAFERLLTSTYGITKKATTDDNISALLLPAAKSVLDAFAGGSANGSALESFGTVFSTGFVLNDDALPADERQTLIDLLDGANQLLATVVRTSRLVSEDSKRTANLSAQLLKLTPYLAFLQAADHAVKRSTSDLLAELVLALNEGTNSDPPSLLGQLSAEAGKNFLAVVTQLGGPLKDLQTECAIWNFLSTVMSSKQQWFAIYVLTGALPKDRLRDHKASKGKPLLVYALDQLSGIKNLPPEKATAILKFIASAQSAWVWATNEVRSHPEFVKSSLDWLHALQPPSRGPNVAQEILSAHEHQMAAYLCDILAVNLHASREVGNKGVLRLVIPKLAFLRDHAGSVNAYNRSLHMNLAENFSRKFSGCNVVDFARTEANPAAFGRNYFYDLDLAGRVLGHEPAWDGPALHGRQQGFAQEFARANVNLSLVDSQRSLLKCWRVLATMLCENIEGEPVLQVELAKTAARCLQANADANLDIPGMDEVINTRADLAFVVISKLVGAKVDDKAMKALLPAAWDLVRSSPVDYGVATAAEDLRYYRTLLQILYLAIQSWVFIKPELTVPPRDDRGANATGAAILDAEIAAVFVQIVARVIAPGFRALCGNLHNSIDLATPTDFALLTAILQALLSVPGIDCVHPQISNVIASTSLIRGALSLYSWADQLAELMAQDPVYGEVSAMFLLALSTLRPVAEQMALDGVLVQLSSANLSNYFRKIGGKGPFDEPRRMFPIWTEAFLPLCLNLLDAVGPAIVGDVAAFLNEFPEQLRRAETSLENVAPSLRNPHAGAVTLGLVSEAHNLCLIGLILESDTQRGAADGINSADVPQLEFDYRKVKDDCAGLVRQRTSLASRIVAVSDREEVWKGMDAGADADNVLMGKALQEIKAVMACFGD